MNRHFLLCLCALLTSLSECSDRSDIEQGPPCAARIFPSDGAFVRENGSVTFSWNVSPGAQSYDLYLGAGSKQPTLIAEAVPGTDFTYAIPAGSDITYHWFVRPRDAAGNIGTCDTQTSFTTKTLPAADAQQKVVNVLVLNYDPDVDDNGTIKKLHEYYDWHDPHKLANDFIDEVLTSSGDLVKYNIVEWRDLNEFPVKNDGFRYTLSSYKACMRNHSGCHAADELDYHVAMHKQGIVEGINQNLFEEVWLFGGPYFGYYESSMAGPNAFYVNGGVYSAPTNKAFVLMGFNYERGVAEMMHNLCHRMESTMSQVYGGWKAEELTSAWANFAANATQSNGTAAVGSCHYPPNALSDYDYGNKKAVMSSADDWFNYPILSGTKKELNCDAWGGPDYHLEYMHWWFSHLPRRTGVGPDGMLNSWWRYLYEFNEYVIN
ncbi:MAG TPA: hypothetical protein VEB86_01340 [Chryseosolibacter sp.]|nr:hypothetical protein [Chryseosolibacter sp.]